METQIQNLSGSGEAVLLGTEDRRQKTIGTSNATLHVWTGSKEVWKTLQKTSFGDYLYKASICLFVYSLIPRSVMFEVMKSAL